MGLLRWVPRIKYEPRKAKLRKALKNMDGPKSLTTLCYYCDHKQRTRANRAALDKLLTDSKTEKRVKKYSNGYKQIEEWKLSGLWIKVDCGQCGRAYLASFPNGDLSYKAKETEVNEGRYESNSEKNNNKHGIFDVDYSDMKDLVELYNSGDIDDGDLATLRDEGEITDTWYNIIRGKDPGE